MDKQNVTLSLPKELLRKAKILAVERNTSLSALLTETLLEIVAAEDRYQTARRHHLNWLKESSDLGTYGQASWTREALHER